MTSTNPSGGVSRRAVLRAGLAAAIAALAAACQRAIGTPSASQADVPSPTAASAEPASRPPTAPPSPEPTATSGRPALSLRQKIARMLIVGFRGTEVGDAPWLQRLVAEGGLGGVILFDRDQATGGPRNVRDEDQVTTLIAAIKALAPDREVIVAIDQEGGVVTRLSPKWGFPSVKSEAAVGEQGDSTVQAWATSLVGTIARVGVNLNFAPVVDIDVNPDNPAIGALDRAFSADAATVSRDAEIEVEAHRAGGVRTALKHFPGLGSATVNTDFGVADVTGTWAPMELDPYRALIQRGLVDMVMAAHVVNGQLDPNAPASLSKATITDLLRGELGWDGVVVTDDMQAAAITEAFGADDAVTLAIEAGCDLLVFANQQVDEPGRAGQVIDLVERLVGEGRIPEARIDESVARLAALFPGG